MKILLVSFFNDEAYGVRSIHAHLVEKGVDARMMFMKLPRNHGESQEEKVKGHFIGKINAVSEQEIDLLVGHIADNSYDLIGFSLVSQHFTLYKRIFERIGNLQSVTIVVGGWQASLNPQDTIHYTDYLCIGEGEEALVELVEKMAGDADTHDIPNFWINTPSGIIKNQVRELQRNLSAYPLPIYEDRFCFVIENNSLTNREPYFANPRYGTFIGRGCPYKCTYCSNSYMAGNVYPGSWSRIRYRDVEHVKEEMRLIKKELKNIRTINFYDEVFSPPLGWIQDFFAWYKDEVAIPFYCFFYPGTCSDEKARLLAEAGMAGVWLGIQSGSERVRRDVFKRHYSNEKIISQAKIFLKYGISVRYDFIFDNPFESFDESLESISLMLELPQPYSLNTFSLKYFPNTEITEMARERGLIEKKDADDHRVTDQDYYLISRETGDGEHKFINYLAYYITNICGAPILPKQKNDLIRLIDDYQATRDLGGIQKLIEPYIQ